MTAPRHQRRSHIGVVQRDTAETVRRRYQQNEGDLAELGAHECPHRGRYDDRREQDRD
jgi:hypothetical protein